MREKEKAGGGEKKLSKTISLPVSQVQVLRQEATEKGVSVATVMTWVIEGFLENAGRV